MQRDNPEMQRRCQEVIDRCWALGDENPIVSIHDVGAGGLSNALPELVNDVGRGARFELREIPTDEPGMSPLEIWCNEAQERYVLAIAPERARRGSSDLRARALPLRGGRHTPPLSAHARGRRRALRQARRSTCRSTCCSASRRRCAGRRARAALADAVRRQPPIELREALLRVLRLPTVADKTFLITIGDRTVGGLSARDQMVGPWQVPVADVRGHRYRVTGVYRRSDGHRRAHAPRAARRRGIGAHGGGRGDHQHRVGADRRAVAT